MAKQGPEPRFSEDLSIVLCFLRSKLYKVFLLRGGTIPNKEGAFGSLLYLSTDPDSVRKTLGKLFKLPEPQSPKLKIRITFVPIVVCSTNI